SNRDSFSTNNSIFYCAENNLTGLEFLQGLFNEKLEIINLANNSINDLSYFKKFIDLRQVYLDNNKFAGSLEPLKYLDKLEELDISNTDINIGLEHLPESIQCFNCSSHRSERKVKLIEAELAPYADTEEGKYNFSNYEVKEKYYDNKIYPETSQKIDENKVLSSEELPTKLYSIKDNKLVKENSDIKNYAILSYVWGDNSDKNKLLEEEKDKLDTL
ncbi:10683_t:CDS:2, partial [Ambispora gerdemannii]